VIVYPAAWIQAADKEKYFPLFNQRAFAEGEVKSGTLNFVMVDCFPAGIPDLTDMEFLDQIGNDPTVVFCLSSTNSNAMQSVRRMFVEIMNRGCKNPAVIIVDSDWQTADEHLIHYATEAGALLLDGMGDGVCFGMTGEAYATYDQQNALVSGRRYSSPLAGGREGAEQFINNTAFIILQATRTRISKTEYISCPSCGRTLFDLQETTAKIRAVTNHLKGVKIAIMGCIVNGPGEMADADFGYVGSGVGKITLYKGKEVVKRNVPSEVAVDELINLLKESEVWVERPVLAS
jgi:(E)-4-hydroxy-3-methylbut-2-enyl-diphosphate synthase